MTCELSLVEIIVLAVMLYGCIMALYYAYEARDLRAQLAAKDRRDDIPNRYS